MSIQFRDLRAQYRHIQREIDAQIQRVIHEGSFILGPQVRELEQRLSSYVGVRHCVSCANGTDALQLVLMAWGIGPGDAVFTSDFSFFASAGTTSIVGATPVFVDIDPRTFNIDPGELERAIQTVLAEGKLTPKVIVPVDIFGLPADYTRIERIAQKYSLRVLEDGAQGFGGALGERRACSFGNAATTSFFPAKPLGCYGDGGAIFTDDDELDTLLRSLRAQGRSPEDKYENGIIGINSRLDTLQAAMLIPKLKIFEQHELEASQRVANDYTQRLARTVITPYIPVGYTSAWAQYSILLKDRAQRDGLQQRLREEGIPSMVYYPRGFHQQGAYRWMNLRDADFPNTVQATQRILSLPMHPYLDEQNIAQVCDLVVGSLQT